MINTVGFQRSEQKNKTKKKGMALELAHKKSIFRDKTKRTESANAARLYHVSLSTLQIITLYSFLLFRQ